MSIDVAQKNFQSLIKELAPIIIQSMNEASTRMRIIDRVLIEVLGWHRDEIFPEPPSESGYIDYLFTVQNYNPLVIEAKRSGAILLDSVTDKMANYKIGGSALKSAQDAVKQALGYCLDQGVPFAAVTTGAMWIGFMTSGAGRPISQRKAIVFPSFDAIQKDFASFYDLFSREGVLSKKYLTIFNRLEGLAITHAGELSFSVADNYVRMLPRTELAQDLEPVFERFFGSLTDDNDRELLLNCFVETKESKEADSSLEKISRDLVNAIETLGTDQGARLAKEIQTAIECSRGEVVLIVGSKGAGKSTFIERFFEHVLARAIREKCLIVRLDMAQAPRRDASTAIADWMIQQLLNLIEQELYRGRAPTYNELLGIFITDYRRWSEGEHQPLYERNPQEFKIKFGEYMYNARQEKPYDYVVKLLQDAVSAKTRLPCLVFDNTDQFPQEFQDAVFQFAQSIYRAVLSILIVPITDRTIWQMSKSGPFQSYPSKTFYLPVPSTKEILQRRVAFIKKKAAESSSQGAQYFLGKGIRLTTKNVEAFAACLEETFLNTDYISRLIGGVANFEIRRSLEVAKRIITSPSLNMDAMIKLHLSQGALTVPDYQIMLALVLGNYNYFQVADSSFVCDLFDVDAGDLSSPLTKLSMLQLFIDKASTSQDLADKYLSLEEVENYFAPMGIPTRIIDVAFMDMIKFRLIEPYNPADDQIIPTMRASITPSGRMHHEMASRNSTYVGQMAIRTGVRTSSNAEQMRAAYNNKTNGKRDWATVVASFMTYCLQEDAGFVDVPSRSEYFGQEHLRSDLRAYWIGQINVGAIGSDKQVG